MITAPHAWKTMLMSLVVLFLLVALADLWIYLRHGYEATISAWLEDNPAWYKVPAIVLILLIIGLGLHVAFLVPHLRGK